MELDQFYNVKDRTVVNVGKGGVKRRAAVKIEKGEGLVNIEKNKCVYPLKLN